MGDGSGPPNPWTYNATDYVLKKISASIPWSATPDGQGNHPISGNASVHRDPGCMYTKVIIGPPALPTFTVPVPVGDSTFTVAQMNAIGLTLIEQVWALNITAIP
jgi:hypothetical protein